LYFTPLRLLIRQPNRQLAITLGGSFADVPENISNGFVLDFFSIPAVRINQDMHVQVI
jgi:hypothetical protein